MDASFLSPSGFSVVRRVNRAGNAPLRPIPEHRLSLHLSRDTRTVCRESGQTFVRIRGDIDVTPANEQLAYTCAEDGSWLELRIPPELLLRVAEACQLPRAHADLGHRHLVRDASLSHLALAIENEQGANTCSERRYLDSLAVALAVRLLSHPAAKVGANAQPATPSSLLVGRVAAFIDANLDSALSLQRLANIAGLSSSHLQREFRASQGSSLHRYIAVRRVERARALLLQRELPASEVALAAGFAHQSHMARWMRRVLGVTPRELVRETREAFQLNES